MSEISNSPSEIIGQLLVNKSLGTDPTLGSTWPVFIANEPDEPDSLIVVTDGVGVKQGRYQVSGEVVEKYGVQVLVRSVTHSAGYSKIDDISVEMDESILNTSVSIDAVTYAIAEISRDSVFSLGIDRDSKKHFFTVNIRVALRQLA